MAYIPVGKFFKKGGKIFKMGHFEPEPSTLQQMLLARADKVPGARKRNTMRAGYPRMDPVIYWDRKAAAGELRLIRAKDRYEKMPKGERAALASVVRRRYRELNKAYKDANQVRRNNLKPEKHRARKIPAGLR